jgi:hypothetical protein
MQAKNKRGAHKQSSDNRVLDAERIRQRVIWECTKMASGLNANWANESSLLVTALQSDKHGIKCWHDTNGHVQQKASML